MKYGFLFTTDNQRIEVTEEILKKSKLASYEEFYPVFTTPKLQPKWLKNYLLTVPKKEDGNNART